MYLICDPRIVRPLPRQIVYIDDLVPSPKCSTHVRYLHIIQLWQCYHLVLNQVLRYPTFLVNKIFVVLARVVRGLG